MQPHFQLALVQLVVLHFLCQHNPGLSVLMVGLIRKICICVNSNEGCGLLKLFLVAYLPI